MDYTYLKERGALNEAARAALSPPTLPRELVHVPRHVLELLPHSVAHENLVLPIALDGEVLKVAAANAADIGLADKLSFIINKKIRFATYPRTQILAAIAHHYQGRDRTESVDSMLEEFTDTALSLEEIGAKPARMRAPPAPPRSGISDLIKDVLRLGKAGAGEAGSTLPGTGEDLTSYLGGSGMLYYVVEEGQRVLLRRPDGAMEVIVGPKRLWKGRNILRPMRHYVAHPGEYLIVRFRDGRQEHLPGPADIWFDPRVHQEITRQDALQIAAKEAVVVYSKGAGSEVIARRIETGPAQFMPQPGEWLHTFSWHASQGGHKGAEKIPNGLVFQKLWLMPDQMYHDVQDVRTADDAVLTVRLMLFFELVDIARMLDTTHDPIGDFINAATSDVVAFTGKHIFEEFKQNVTQLNELESYRQLTSRAQQCGYRINKVVFRGYGAPQALQQMHDQAIQARTKLQLDRATEQQAQDLENYKLDCQISRSTKRRTEQSNELEHELQLSRRREENQMTIWAEHQNGQREQRRLEMEQQLEAQRRRDAEQREHLAALREFGVDLTAYLTQARADRVIELRGAAGNAHVHLEPGGNGDHAQAAP